MDDDASAAAERPPEQRQPAFPKPPREPGFAPHLRRAMRGANIDHVRAVTACFGVVVAGAIVFFQAIIIADSDGRGPSYDPLYQANAVVRWTLPISSALWIISFLPILAVPIRRALVWTSLALVLGSGFGWYAWLAIDHH